MNPYDYRKLQRGDAGFERVQEMKNRAIWMCDSYDHNEPEGCSNPDCFKNKSYKNREWFPPPVLGDI